jgi:hypothetical protein
MMCSRKQRAVQARRRGEQTILFHEGANHKKGATGQVVPLGPVPGPQVTPSTEDWRTLALPDFICDPICLRFPQEVAMDPLKSPRDWRIVAEEASHEQDGEKMMELMEELLRALEQKHIAEHESHDSKDKRGPDDLRKTG